jgi:hypothetical protein
MRIAGSFVSFFPRRSKAASGKKYLTVATINGKYIYRKKGKQNEKIFYLPALDVAASDMGFHGKQ